MKEGKEEEKEIKIMLSSCYDIIMAVTFRKPLCSQVGNGVKKTNCSLEWNPS
jgi:hypothetical protein